MNILAWIKQFLTIASITVLVLTLVQYSKLQDWQSALNFGALWGVISALVFVGVKAYKYKKAGLPIVIE